MNKFLFYILFIGLLGSITNLVFISPLPTLIAALLLPIVFVLRADKKVPKFVIYLYAFMGISILSAFLYDPKALISFLFYRYDGNLFISYLPLLFFPFFSLKINTQEWFRSFFYFSTLINLLFYIFKFIVTKGGVLLAPAAPGNQFTYFFLATNAAGGFYSMILSLIYAFYLKQKKRRYILLIILNFLFLWSTTSRGSLLGVILGVSFFQLKEARKGYLVYLGFSTMLALQAAILSYSYPLYKKYLFTSADIGNDSRAFIAQQQGSVDVKTGNIWIRVFDTWPRGLSLFLNSPIFGSGFGATNDIPLKFTELWPGLISYNSQANHVYNDSHAHHSFLHILGEQGIIGLGLFLLFWISLYQYLNKSNKGDPIRAFLLIGFMNLSVMSLTEHRITTPSNALPFVISICIFVMNENYKKRPSIQNSANVN